MNRASEGDAAGAKWRSGAGWDENLEREAAGGRSALECDSDVYEDECMKQLRIETEVETDGRWLAEVVEIPGAMAYGATRQDAVAKAEALAFRILADRLEHGEINPFNEQDLPFKAE
jgi:predicted RNase H-like HicB family nuclease